jgi:hypothetical protein
MKASHDELHLRVGAEGLLRGPGAATAAADEPDAEGVVPGGHRPGQQCHGSGGRGRRLEEYAAVRIGHLAASQEGEGRWEKSIVPESLKGNQKTFHHKGTKVAQRVTKKTEDFLTTEAQRHREARTERKSEFFKPLHFLVFSVSLWLSSFSCFLCGPLCDLRAFVMRSSAEVRRSVP